MEGTLEIGWFWKHSRDSHGNPWISLSRINTVGWRFGGDDEFSIMFSWISVCKFSEYLFISLNNSEFCWPEFIFVTASEKLIKIYVQFTNKNCEKFFFLNLKPSSWFSDKYFNPSNTLCNNSLLPLDTKFSSIKKCTFCISSQIFVNSPSWIDLPKSNTLENQWGG